MIVALKEILHFDPTVVEIADLPPGYMAERKGIGSTWERRKKRQMNSSVQTAPNKIVAADSHPAENPASLRKLVEASFPAGRLPMNSDRYALLEYETWRLST